MTSDNTLANIIADIIAAVEANPIVLRQDIGYQAAHDRVRAFLGEPSEHTCHAHGEHPAKEWALVPGSPDERVQADGRHAGKRFSPDPADYIPLCISAHRKMDAAEAKARRERAA